MTSRNAPCPCGSGKKYKRCHGRAASGSLPAGGQTHQQLLEQARRFEQQKRYADALSLLRRLPRGAPRYSLEALIYMNGLDKPARADKVLQAWQRQDRRNADPVQRRLQLLWRADDNEAAVALLPGLDQRPHEHNDYYRAIAWQRVGELEKARPYFRQSIVHLVGDDFSTVAMEFEIAAQMLEVAAGVFPGVTENSEKTLADDAEIYALVSAAGDRWWRQREEFPGLPETMRKHFVSTYYNLGCRDQEIYGRGLQAIEFFRRTRVLDPDNILAHTNWAFLHNYRADLSAAERAAAHFDVGRALRASLGPAKNDFRPVSSANRPLRIGFLSADFHEHPVAYFLTPVLEALDRDRFRLFAYSNNMYTDEWTLRVRRAVDVFRSVGDKRDSALYQQILADRIDILFDLHGYSRGLRIEVLARRAAPLQIAWIGYPNTTGLDSIDYRIVDHVTDPEPEADALNSEKLLRLPRLFSVYGGPERLPDLPAREQPGPFVFGSLNNIHKLNKKVFSAWAEILAGTPGSRLYIKAGQLDSPATRENLLAALEAAGIDLRRVELQGRVEPLEKHLLCFPKADLLLDSFPYNGTTTNCQSFLMGVPVLAIAGEGHASRVTASQLNALEMPELIASDVEDYVRRAIAFASDPAALRPLAKDLRQRMLSSPLMDAASLARELEATLEQTWVQYMAGREPSPG